MRKEYLVYDDTNKRIRLRTPWLREALALGDKLSDNAVHYTIYVSWVRDGDIVE